MTDLIDTRAAQLAEALSTCTQIAPLSSEANPPSVSDAYAIADRLRAMQNRTRIGLKVGFTNRAIWPIYDVHQPIWGAVYAEGLFSSGDTLSLSPYAEPRIEPEIVLGLGRAPTPGMSREDLARCIDWVAPGFELVQSIYPDWKIDAADSIAAQGMHGALILGNKIDATEALREGLPAVTLDLFKDDGLVDSGIGANALDGPLEVLAHLVSLLTPDNALKAGELVSTGTLTDAPRVAAGETWKARYGGAIEAEITVTLR